MSPQHDFIIDNSTGANVRADINSVLQAIASNNSGSSAPSTTYALQSFANTTDSMLQLRNAANNAFVNLRKFDGTLPLPDGSAASPSLFFDDDTNTGLFSSAADTFDITTAGTQRLSIDSSGRVLIGTTTEGHANSDDLTIATSGHTGITLRSGTSNNGSIFFSDGTSGSDEFRGFVQYTHTSDFLTFGTNASERMRLDSSGNCAIGDTSPLSRLHIEDTSGAVLTLGNSQSPPDVVTGTVFGRINFFASDRSGTQATGGVARIEAVATLGYSAGSPCALLFYTHGTGANDGSVLGTPLERMRISESGLVGIGTNSPVNKLEVDNGSDVCFARISTSNTGSGVAGLIIANSSKTAFNDGIKIKHGAGIGLVTGLDDTSICRFTPNDGASGNFHVFGALSKGSGSFLIDHPLESKKDTHNLVHSFIEGPQADLIYRGKIALSGGSATVNIDTVSGMSEGTFVALNRNVQCFTTNETGWLAVKGSVSGNILTITAEDNSCSDTISWLVIGERQDQHMKETTWTDNDGKVIVEPLKD